MADDNDTASTTLTLQAGRSQPPDISSTPELTAEKPTEHPPIVPPAELPPAEADPAPSLAESPEPKGQADKPPQETPVTTLVKQHPELRNIPTDQVVQKIGEMFPNVPFERVKVYAQQPGGAQLLRQYDDRNLSILERFRKEHPDYATGDTGKDIQFLYNNFAERDETLQNFTQRVNPPPAVVAALTNGVLSGLQATYAKWEQFPKAATDAIGNLNKVAGTYGWIQAASDWMAKNVPGYGAANNFFVQSVNNLHERGKQWEKQSGQAAEKIPALAKDPVSQIVGTIGEVVGQAPDIAVSFGLGSTGKAAALWGSLYEGTSAYGHAIEWQQKNALWQGVSSAGFRGFTQYLLNTGKGRIVTGVANALASVAQDEIDKLLRGDPNNDITKELKPAAVGLLIPLLLGGGEKEPAPYKAPESLEKPVTAASVLGPEVSETQAWYTQPPIQTRPHIGVFTPSQFQTAAERMPSRGTPEQMSAAAKGFGSEVVFSGQAFRRHPPAARVEFAKAREAHENGDNDTAAQYIDRGLVLTPDETKRQLAHDFTDKVDELAGDTKKTTPTAKDEAFNDYYFGGLSDPVPEEKPAIDVNEFTQPAIKLPDGQIVTEWSHSEAWEQAGKPDPKTLTDGYVNDKGQFITVPEREQALGEQERQRVEQETQRISAEATAPQPAPTAGVPFYSGVPIPQIPAKTKKAVEDWFDSNRPGILPKVAGAGSPEYKSAAAEVGGAIMKAEEAKSRSAMAVIPSTIARESERVTGFTIPKSRVEQFFDKWTSFRFGNPIQRAERVFNNFTTAELKKQFIAYEEGRVDEIKDPTAKWLWKNVFKSVMDSIAKRDHDYGITYDYGDRENYVYHLMTHPNDAMPKLREAMVRQGINPRFVKPQQMRLAERLALGHEMITVNPIRLMQARWWASERAIQKIRDLREMEAQGLAWNTKDEGKNIPQSLRNQVNPDNQVKTADGQSYYVHPDLIEMLNNKFSPVADAFRDAGGPFFKFLQALKVIGSPLKLSWSLFHPLHVMDITQADVATDALKHMMSGVGNWNDAFNVAMNQVPFAGGLVSGTRAYRKYADEVNYLQGKVDFRDLTPEQQRNIQDFRDIGLVAGINEERQMQFTRWIQDNAPKWVRDGGPLVKMGLDLFGNPLNFNKWWFGTVTPRLKFASAMMRRDTLEKTRPELFRDNNRAEKLREFQAINRDVEGRYGEMHYDNLFWPRWYKQAGTSFLLSLGWQTGMFRTLGDGVVDLTRNPLHMDEIAKGWKAKDPAARKLVTNRMAFTAMYLARGIATGWAISYFVGRKNPAQITLWDGVYPVVGTDQDGREKRVNMQYFIKDIPALYEYSRMKGSELGGASQMILNKMNPMAMAVLQAAFNKDYMGHTISTKEGFDNYVQRLQYLGIEGIAPISFQNMQVPGQTWGDKFMATLGYSPSGRWTMRSDLENRIMAEATSEKSSADMANARDKYRQAYLAHDQGIMKEAHDELRRLDVSEKSIKGIEKHAHISSAQNAFRMMDSHAQARIWHTIPVEEQRQLWPYVHKDMKLHHEIWLGQQ